MSVCTDLGNGSLSRDEGTKCKDDEGGAKHTEVRMTPVSKQRLRLKTTELGSPFMRRQVVMGPHDGAAY